MDKKHGLFSFHCINMFRKKKHVMILAKAMILLVLSNECEFKESGMTNMIF
jgi:hypothetical protein